MFTNKERIDRKSAASGRGRLEYLQALVTEFQDTENHDSKVQILANLANFAYDPINYDHFRKLNVPDLFLVNVVLQKLDMLTEEDDKLVEFGIGGICNLCLDEQNKCHIIRNEGIELVIKCLSSKSDIITESIIESMKKISVSSNIRLKNLATIFLEDYCNQS